MPSTPDASSKDDITVQSAAYDECRQNALKNRKENDWFGHEAQSTTSGPRPCSASSVRTPNKTSQESEQWFRYDVNGTSPLAVKPEATYRAKGRVHADQQDWYKHGDDVPDPPSLEKRSKTRSRRSACAEVRQKTTDPNEWFRHDHKADGCGATDESQTNRKPIKMTSPTALWVVYPENEGGSELASTPRPKSRLTVPEADEYYRRDKLGSSANWFSHEHSGDDISSWGCLSGVRIRGTPEGGEIANRLKGESENWFSHDGNQNYVSPLRVVKGNSLLARELMERAQGLEMKQIFHVEGNLRATWTAPPPLTETPSSAQSHGQASLGQNPIRDDTVENVQEMMDSLLRNGHKDPSDKALQ